MLTNPAARSMISDSKRTRSSTSKREPSRFASRGPDGGATSSRLKFSLVSLECPGVGLGPTQGPCRADEPTPRRASRLAISRHPGSDPGAWSGSAAIEMDPGAGVRWQASPVSIDYPLAAPTRWVVTRGTPSEGKEDEPALYESLAVSILHARLVRVRRSARPRCRLGRAPLRGRHPEVLRQRPDRRGADPGVPQEAREGALPRMCKPLPEPRAGDGYLGRHLPL